MKMCNRVITMWWIAAIVIVFLIVYAVFSKPVRKPRRLRDLAKENGYSPANESHPTFKCK
jgi:flagellar biosynthesis/type III secretory pathway M-ring protein FliF/YscJ